MGHLIDAEKYEKYIADICESAGLSREDAEISAKVLVGNDQLGMHTHGVYHLDSYINKFPSKGIDPKAVCEVVKEGPSWALMDAHHSMGPVSAWRGMEKAIEKARKTGVAYVGVKDGSHFGTCAYFSLMAAKENMISIVCANTIKLMAVPGGRGKIVGNSPICFGLPAENHHDVFLDIATSNVSFSKVLRAREAHEQVPPGWIVDGDGLPTTDPNGEGVTLLPFANHKGYGISLFIEALTGVLADGKILGEVCQNGMDVPENPFNVSYAFLVIDAQTILGGRFNQRMDKAIEEVVNSPKAVGSDRIYMPGEIEMEKAAKAAAEGIDLPEDVYEHAKALGERFGMDISACLK